jgi:hypothetical protein
MQQQCSTLRYLFANAGRLRVQHIDDQTSWISPAADLGEDENYARYYRPQTASTFWRRAKAETTRSSGAKVMLCAHWTHHYNK